MLSAAKWPTEIGQLVSCRAMAPPRSFDPTFLPFLHCLSPVDYCYLKELEQGEPGRGKPDRNIEVDRQQAMGV